MLIPIGSRRSTRGRDDQRRLSLRFKAGPGETRAKVFRLLSPAKVKRKLGHVPFGAHDSAVTTLPPGHSRHNIVVTT
jgi:hypothetical protein